MVRPKGVVFDLDDTLYLERDYVRSGFFAVAGHLAEVGYDAAGVFQTLWGGFCSGVRGSAFDLLLARMDATSVPVTIDDLVTIYREHLPEIELLPGLSEILQLLKTEQVPLGVITDGPLASQRAKAAALGLAETFDKIVFTDAWGRDFWKPHTRAFVEMSKFMNLTGSDLIYIADNPSKDFVGPHELGWETVQLRVQGQLHASNRVALPARRSLSSIEDLGLFLREWIGSA